MVQKFGGSSVATKEKMLLVLKKVRAGLAAGCKMLVVLSARAGETNNLLALASEWSDTPDPAECDVLVSTGEQVSVALFAMLLKDAGIKARSCTGGQVGIVCNDVFGKARVKQVSVQTIEALFHDHDVLVVAGFQGVTEDGRITTLGRGGSDTSAVALAAAVKAELCEIYTDVEGVFTTDPNVCAKARKLDQLTYNEMLEMASMGAKVLEIRSVEFAKKFNVPLVVRSTFSDAPGTLITQEDQIMEQIVVSSITYNKDQAWITLRAVRDMPGIAASIFTPLAEANLSVDMIVQTPSRDGVTDMNFTVPQKDLKRAMAVMDQVCKNAGCVEVLYDAGVAKVSAIGVGMINHSGVAAKLFVTLQKENINIIMISTSEIKISFIIEEKYTELAVRALHDAFGLDQGPYLEG